jgi:hypothetical protein
MKMNALKLALSLLLALLFAVPVVAAPPSGVALQTSSGDLLLYGLPSGMSAGHHEMEVAFRRQAKSLAVEKLSFETTRGERALAVELLTGHPKQRVKILRMATDPTSAVEVSIVLDGRQTVLPLESLIVQTGTLQREHAELVHARLETPATHPFLTKDAHDDCVADCYNNYYACSDPCTDYACIQDCQYWFNQCYYGCPPGCSGPSVRNYSTVTLTSSTWSGSDCYREPFPSTSNWQYDKYYRVYHVNNYRETTQCDGSKTTELVSSYNYGEYCLTRFTFFGSCSYPWGGNASSFPACN